MESRVDDIEKGKKKSTFGKVLIVDDEVEIVEILAEFFAQKGYEVSSAHDGVEGLSKVKKERPHIVLLDIRMPGMNGIDVLRNIKEIDSNIGVIMITANEDIEVAKQSLALGAFDYISKPFDFNYLERSVFTKIAQMVI